MILCLAAVGAGSAAIFGATVRPTDARAAVNAAEAAAPPR